MAFEIKVKDDNDIKSGEYIQYDRENMIKKRENFMRVFPDQKSRFEAVYKIIDANTNDINQMVGEIVHCFIDPSYFDHVNAEKAIDDFYQQIIYTSFIQTYFGPYYERGLFLQYDELYMNYTTICIILAYKKITADILELLRNAPSQDAMDLGIIRYYMRYYIHRRPEHLHHEPKILHFISVIFNRIDGLDGRVDIGDVAGHNWEWDTFRIVKNIVSEVVKLDCGIKKKWNIVEELISIMRRLGPLLDIDGEVGDYTFVCYRALLLLIEYADSRQII
jgi:hypothetical protein